MSTALTDTEGLDGRTRKLCAILRDADKIDILKVNVEIPLEEIYNTTTEALRNSQVTEAVMDAFFEHHCILRSLKKTPVDIVVGHISLTYELVYPESLKIVKEQGYLNGSSILRPIIRRPGSSLHRSGKKWKDTWKRLWQRNSKEWK